MTKRWGTVLAVAFASLASCRGSTHEHTPIHPNLNMDYQERFDPQEANDFFADGRSMRPPVPGAVARGFLREDTRYHDGRDSDGAYVDVMPIPMTLDVLERGRVRYDIFCAPCHGAAGDGEGLITTGGFGYVPAPTYHSDRLREETDGYMYDVIANGVRTMPGYAQQIPVADRWAIVAYIRALQRSQYASGDDAPAAMLEEMRRGAPVGSNE